MGAWGCSYRSRDRNGTRWRSVSVNSVFCAFWVLSFHLEVEMSYRDERDAMQARIESLELQLEQRRGMARLAPKPKRTWFERLYGAPAALKAEVSLERRISDEDVQDLIFELRGQTEQTGTITTSEGATTWTNGKLRLDVHRRAGETRIVLRELRGRLWMSMQAKAVAMMIPLVIVLTVAIDFATPRWFTLPWLDRLATRFPVGHFALTTSVLAYVVGRWRFKRRSQRDLRQLETGLLDVAKGLSAGDAGAKVRVPEHEDAKAEEEEQVSSSAAMCEALQET